MEPEIREVVGGPDLEDVRTLFREYADWIGIDLSFQDFSRELRELPGEYASPEGTLLLCRVHDAAAGCVAVRSWREETSEMKRLFVREQFRGGGCGALLAERAIVWARSAGYKRILLDTLPSMVTAQHLYERLGFREVPPYRFNPIEGARFMELSLSEG